jgi:hypothetical protein
MLSASAWNRRGMCMEFAGNWKLQSERHKPHHQLTASASKVLYFARETKEKRLHLACRMNVECKFCLLVDSKGHGHLYRPAVKVGR